MPRQTPFSPLSNCAGGGQRDRIPVPTPGLFAHAEERNKIGDMRVTKKFLPQLTCILYLSRFENCTFFMMILDGRR